VPGSAQPPAAERLEQARERVAAAARTIAAKGLVIGTGGNISERIDGGHVAITATGADLETLAPEQVSIVDGRGELIHGELAPSSEIQLHLGIYDGCGAGAVVHTHSPFATALACTLKDEVPCVHYSMLLLGGAVPVAAYRTFGTPELAEVTLDALEERTAALMANHGAIVHAQDLHTAVEMSLVLEWACGVYWRAAAIGTPRTLGDSQRTAVVEAVLERGYGGLQAKGDG
jgi:L-fuculose-phosphate aldolase